MDGRSDESKQGANQEWMEIVRARSAMEAHAIRILLEEHGFDVRIDGEASADAWPSEAGRDEAADVELWRRLAALGADDCTDAALSSHRYWITFNGEVYNFLELRQELEAAGHRFRAGAIIVPNADRAAYLRGALEYMGIAPGKKLTDIAVDRVFIGSCTNSRIEDLRAAAAVLAGRTSKVPGLVSAGSTLIKRQAEQEGLDRIFLDAGLEWGESGCSMCVGINGDLVAAGERCASTTNRNFRGRQGPGARTHLMSPAMVAAAAVTGHLADVRPLLSGRKV